MSTVQIRGFRPFPIVLESTVRPHAPQLKRGLTLTVMMEKAIDFESKAAIVDDPPKTAYYPCRRPSER